MWTKKKKKRKTQNVSISKDDIGWVNWWYKPVGFCDWLAFPPTPTPPPHISCAFDDIDVDVGWFDGDAEFCVDKPITFTPFTWPLLALPNKSFPTGGGGWFVCDPGCECWCLSAFVRRFVTVTSRLRRTCSTGNTRRRFFGSFERA